MIDMDDEWTDSPIRAALIGHFEEEPHVVTAPRLGWPASAVMAAIPGDPRLWRGVIVQKVITLSAGTTVTAHDALRYLTSHGVKVSNPDSALVLLDGYLVLLRESGVLRPGPGGSGFATAGQSDPPRLF